MNPKTRWHVLEDAGAVAEEAARRVQIAAARAIAEAGVFRIVLAGGRTPQIMHGLLVKAATDWSRWQIYFGDERCLPADHQERNSKAAALAWLDRVPIPQENIHPIPAEQGAESATLTYTRLIAPALPFDLVTLGVGEDGHTASLFPGQSHPAQALVHAVHDAPKPPPDRVSLSVRALSRAGEILILVTGGGEAGSGCSLAERGRAAGGDNRRRNGGGCPVGSRCRRRMSCTIEVLQPILSRALTGHAWQLFPVPEDPCNALGCVLKITRETPNESGNTRRDAA